MFDPQKQIYNTTAWKRLRAAIKTRDGHRCTLCNTVTGRLIVDHIDPITADNPDLWFEPSNLRLLCHSCHERRRTTNGTTRSRCRIAGQQGHPIDCPSNHSDVSLGW